MRLAPGGGVIGWDMTAALALAAALDLPARAAAELLPRLETGMVRALNQRIREVSDGGQE